MSAASTSPAVRIAWSPIAPDGLGDDRRPLSCGCFACAGPSTGIGFAVGALRAGQGDIRFPWMAAAAVSGSLGGFIGVIVAVLRIAGMGD